MDQKENLSVFGLGKLGSTMLACFAHKGWRVIGVDINEDFVKQINNGKSPVYEPQVNELISSNKNRIEATIEAEFAVLHSDVSFIMVPTPSQEDGLFSTKYVEDVIREIAKALIIKDDYHVIVITSTVLPGDCERIGNKIKEMSGKKVGRDFGLIYNPEFIALGKIVQDFLNPDMVLIGESDNRAGNLIESIHKRLTNSKPSIHRMNLYNAELAKISLNAYCTLKITFANTIAEICENIPGGDAEKVLQAIGTDKRIGNKYFRGGLGFAGPCFPRDNRALAKSAEKFGITNLYCNLTDEINEYHKTNRICNLLLELMKEKDTCELAILGLSYKENTPIIEESVSIEVIKALTKKDIKISIYDPVAMEMAEAEFSDNENVTFELSKYSCIRRKSVCFIATPWKEFEDLDSKRVISSMNKDSVILDAWGILPFKSEKGSLEIRYIGKNYK